MAFSGAGTLTGGSTIPVTIHPGATLLLDDSAMAVANRLGGRAITINGGTLAYVSRGSANSSETLGILTLAAPSLTINTTSSGSASSVLTFASLTANGAATMVFRNATAAFGSPQNVLKFTTAPTLVQAGSGVLARSVVIDPNGTNFATISSGSVVAFSYANYAANGGTVIALGGTSGNTGLNTIQSTDNVKLSGTATDYASPGIVGRALNSLLMSGTTSLGLPSSGGLGLTITSGNLLLTGGNGMIGNAALAGAGSAPTLNSGATETALLVDSNSTLTLNASVVSTGNVTKGLPGTLILSAKQFFNTGNNWFTLSAGTVILNGGTNTLWQGIQGGVAGQNLIVAPGATLDLNGNSQMVGDINYINNIQVAGGRITSAAPATFVFSPAINNTGTTRYFGGQIDGALSLNINIFNLLVLGEAATYTGSTIINGATNRHLLLRDGGALTNTTSVEINYGGLVLDNSVANSRTGLNNRLNDSAPITMRGGYFGFSGRDNANIAETVGNMTLAEGLSQWNISLGGGGVRSTQLNMGTLTVNPDATLVMYTQPLGLMGSYMRINIANGNSLLVNGIYPWATTSGDFLTYFTSSANGLSGGLAVMGGAGAPAYDATVPSANIPIQNVKLAQGSYTFPDLTPLILWCLPAAQPDRTCNLPTTAMFSASPRAA
jgi:hypothetical protein